jgi:hypothetical protein
VHRTSVIRLADAEPESWIPQATLDPDAEDEESAAAPTNASQEITTIPIMPSTLQHEHRPCIQIIPRILQSHGIKGDWRTWALAVIHADGIFEADGNSKPFCLFKLMEEQGKMPELILKKRPHPKLWSEAAGFDEARAPVPMRDSGAFLEDLANQRGVEIVKEGTALKIPPPQETTSLAEEDYRRDMTSGIKEENLEYPHNKNSITDDSPKSNVLERPSVEKFKSFHMGLEDPCYKVLSAALRKYGIKADWLQYAIYIEYGDQKRRVGLEEKPLALFRQLDGEGKKPMFMLRKLANPPV